MGKPNVKPTPVETTEIVTTVDASQSSEAPAFNFATSLARSIANAESDRAAAFIAVYGAIASADNNDLTAFVVDLNDSKHETPRAIRRCFGAKGLNGVKLHVSARLGLTANVAALL